jgi:acyl dehydratase
MSLADPSAEEGTGSMRTFQGIEELKGAVGTHLGESGWRTVSQGEVDLFANATGDRQWIHVDPERAKSGPFGGTVAHGYLTLALIPQMVWQIYSVEGIGMALNYGTNKVRFPAPLLVGTRIRASVDLISLEPAAGGFQEVLKVIVEQEGADKPACVAETVAILFPLAESRP